MTIKRLRDEIDYLLKTSIDEETQVWIDKG